jgi:CHAT domain-containing protein
MKFIISAFLQFLPFFVLGQSLPKAQDYLDRSDYRRAVPLYEQISKEAKLNHNLDLQIEAQNGLADCYIDLGATYKAMAILKLNIVLVNKATTKNDLLLAKTHQLLAICYDKLFLIEEYLTETKTFYSYYKKAAPKKEIYKALYYAYLGRYYNMRFIVDKAFTYTSTALKIYHKQPEEKEVDPYIFYNAHLFTERNHAPTLAIKFQYVDSLRYFINKRYPYDNLKKARLMVSIAAPNIEVAANLYYNSGDYKLNIECADRAISFYNEAIAMNDKLAGFYHPNAAFLNSLKGLMLFYKKDYKGALENYEIGIKRLTLSSYLFTNNNAILFDLLKWKAWCLNDMYIQNKDTKLLYEIEKTLLLEEKYWSQYAHANFKNKQKFNTNGYTFPPYSEIAGNYYKLFKATGKEKYISLYYEYNEKSKYTSLLENLNSAIEEEESDDSNTTIKNTYECFDDLILNVNSKIIYKKNVESKFDKSYKTYVFNQKKMDFPFIGKITSLKEVQNKLKENEAILSYNVSAYQGHFFPFILMISNHKIKLLELKSENGNFHDQEPKVNNLLVQLKQNIVSNYKKLAFGYYKSYFEPIVCHIPKNITHIKIIPDNYFCNLPFEMLLSAPATSNDFSKLPYLVKKYQFSYGLSSSIANIVEKKASKSNTFSVFNPSFSTKNLTELKESNTKSQEFADLFDGHLIQGKDATKKAFSKHLENDRIVALLSHGSASDDEIESNKGIHFSDGFLSMNEVYNLKANCDFLLLGACESGVGYKSREGNINLARAFTAIGVKSMMLASWKIDEKSSSQIISSFLKYLDSGCTKSEALQKTKLDYLATASPRMANPLYWAGLNITGNNETIELHQRNYCWLDLVLFFVGIAVVFIAQRYIKRHRR